MITKYLASVLTASSTQALEKPAEQKIDRFSKFFKDKTLRIDYYHTGDAKSDEITIDTVYENGIWSGTRNSLIDTFERGAYYVKVYDKATNELIYSRGYSSYFEEYQMTGPAIKGIKKTYHETALIPSPKSDVKIVIEKLDRTKGDWLPVFETELDPKSVSIVRESEKDNEVKVVSSHLSCDPRKSLDIVIVGEGYTLNEEAKFEADIERFTQKLLETEPYTQKQDKINIYGTLRFSDESGVDEPRANIFRRTPINATFNSLGSERYLMTEDNRSLRDVAGNVPYDSIYLMINTERYGGGGIYGQYATFPSDNQWSDYIFTHEFGHSLTGLGDEYYTSSVEYNDFYPRGIEPKDPNITALLDTTDLKWGAQVKEGTKIPTPWEKEQFDKEDMARQEIRTKLNDRVAELKKKRAPKAEIDAAIEEAAEFSRQHAKAATDFLDNSAYVGIVGAYEGSGYSSTGLYRPSVGQCVMFRKGDVPFCDVCKTAITEMIDYYTE